MKRRDFINQLTRIAELNSQATSVKEIPLFCCRQFKINQRMVPRAPQESQPRKVGKSSSNINKEVVLIMNDESGRRGESAFIRKQEAARQRPTRRLLTTPSSLTIAGRHNRQKKLQQDLFRPSAPKQNIVSSEKAQQPSDMRQSCYTEPCQFPQKINASTSRVLYVSSLSSKKQDSQSNSRARPGSAFKHSSMKMSPSRQVPGEDRRITVTLRRELMNSYKRPFDPPPKLTAKSYIIYEIKPSPEESSLVFSFNSKNSQEVASLTKIMTCLLTLELCQQFNVNRLSEEVLIGKMEASLGGTTANLQSGQIYTVDQLLFGLMLPSGNDASVALAVWGGRKLLLRERQANSQTMDKQGSTLMQSTLSCLRSTTKDYFSAAKKSECYSRFLKEMNCKARQLKMTKTNYSNSHGLINQNNKSTAYDVAILSSHAMQNPLFREIVQTKEYRGIIRAKPRRKSFSEENSSEDESNSDFFNPENTKLSKVSAAQRSPSRQGPVPQKSIAIQWKNTHKLLHLKPNQYIGIKTGFTTMAGPCLCSCVSVQNRQFVIVVLSCSKMNLRFKQTQLLRRWLFKREGFRRKKRGDGEEEEKMKSLMSEREGREDED